MCGNISVSPGVRAGWSPCTDDLFPQYQTSSRGHTRHLQSEKVFLLSGSQTSWYSTLKEGWRKTECKETKSVKEGWSSFLSLCPHMCLLVVHPCFVNNCDFILSSVQETQLHVQVGPFCMDLTALVTQSWKGLAEHAWIEDMSNTLSFSQRLLHYFGVWGTPVWDMGDPAAAGIRTLKHPWDCSTSSYRCSYSDREFSRLGIQKVWMKSIREKLH